MPLLSTQAIVTVAVPSMSLSRAATALEQALIPYPHARIISLIQKTNWWDGFGTTNLLAVIEYTPPHAP
jgi:hypothetical protein